MLTEPNLFAAIQKLLTICVRFAKFTMSSVNSLVPKDVAAPPLKTKKTNPKEYSKQRYQRRKQRIEAVKRQAQKGFGKEFAGNVQKFEKFFNYYIRNLITSLTTFSSPEYDYQLANFTVRLDFNHFYKNKYHFHRGAGNPN